MPNPWGDSYNLSASAYSSAEHQALGMASWNSPRCWVHHWCFFHRIALVILLCTHLYQCICHLIPIFVFIYIISSMQSFDMYIPADWAKNTYSTPFLHETKSPFLPRLEAVDVLHSRGHAVLNLEGIDRQAALDAARRIWDAKHIWKERKSYLRRGGYDMECRLQFHLFVFLLKWWFISLFWLHISALCSLYGNFSWGRHGASFKAGRYQWMCRGVRSLTLRSPVSNSDLSGSAGDLESLASFFWTLLVQRRHRWGAVPWQPKVSFLGQKTDRKHWTGWMHFSFYDWNMLKRNG